MTPHDQLPPPAADAAQGSEKLYRIAHTLGTMPEWRRLRSDDRAFVRAWCLADATDRPDIGEQLADIARGALRLAGYLDSAT